MSVNSDQAGRQRSVPVHHRGSGELAADRGAPPGETPQTLYRRPGFLIRRVHQIASAVFADECGEHGATTPLQYGALVLLASESGVDQITLARRLGLDRSTAGLVVRNLAERGLVERSIDPADTRRRLLALTARGRAELEALIPRAQRAQARLLAPLDREEQRVLLDALERLATTFNVLAPEPLERP